MRVVPTWRLAPLLAAAVLLAAAGAAAVRPLAAAAGAGLQLHRDDPKELNLRPLIGIVSQVCQQFHPWLLHVDAVPTLRAPPAAAAAAMPLLLSSLPCAAGRPRPQAPLLHCQLVREAH